MVLTQLDFLWERVQRNPDRLEEAVREVLNLLDVTPLGARTILQDPVMPSKKIAKERRPREADHDYSCSTGARRSGSTNPS